MGRQYEYCSSDDERPMTSVVRMAVLCEGWEIDGVHDARKKTDSGREPMIPIVRGVGYMLRQSE